ncbi:N-acetylglucosamine kinase [Paenibacillus sp. MBLB4367]|uniref:N-acetylglucosamine kinase n=1 Tax=Paenibacillus sp. MBLB4367 TaxID=3384767 RepID=UPI003907EBA2
MMKLVLGIDGGGTKTEALALDQNGDLLLRLTGESTNPHAVTFPKAMRNLGELLDAALASPAIQGFDLTAAALGLSGVSTEEEQRAVQRYLQDYQKERQMTFDVSLLHDAQIALMATLGREEGIIAISGTGSIVFGLSPEGERYRVGGWGHLLGDEGSGYEIGLRTLRTIMRSFDGIIPPTRMTDLLLEAYGFSSLAELKPYIYNDSIQKSDIAKFAEICIRASEDDDKAAVNILLYAAGELADAAIALIGKNEWFQACDLVTTGSIFTHSSRFSGLFREKVAGTYPGVTLHASTQPPAYGAALLALKRYREHNSL